ncbi:MAG: hypothetical protein ACP5JG_14645 [Anaerolineae bacterium]
MSLYETYSLTAREPEYLTDPFVAPDWLRYARTVCLDGYSPPVTPTVEDFDARQVAEIALDLGGDTVRIQPIGYWATYPSRAFRVLPDLGNRDLFQESVTACREAGLHVYAYCPYAHPHMTAEWLSERPAWDDWVCRNPDGTPRGGVWHYGSAFRLAVHRLGATYREAIRTVVREYCSYDVDGVYFDAPSGLPMYTELCFCDECRANFRAFAGMDIDRLQDPDDLEARVAWQHWTVKVTQEDLLDFRKIIHESGKFMGCHNGGAWRGDSLRQQYQIPDGFMVEFSRQTYQRIVHGLLGASMARGPVGRAAQGPVRRKLAQMYLGSYDVKDFGQPVHADHWGAHNTNLEDSDEIRMEGLVTLACGNAPIYSMANRMVYGIGDGSRAPAQEIFGLMAEMEPLLKDSLPVPYVTVVPSWDTLRLWQSGREAHNTAMTEGFALAMLDGRVSFDVFPNTEITVDWLEAQRVIALTGASCMSDAEADLLTQWVAEGGGLLVTWDTGLYDADGSRRRGALQELLGVEMTGEPLGTRPDTYLRVCRSHPILGERAPAQLMMGDVRNVPVDVADDTTVLADVWDLGRGASRGPGIVTRAYGAGHVVYLSVSLEAMYTATRIPSLRETLVRAVRWLGRDAPPLFTLKAPTGVYGLLRRTPDGDLLLWILANVGFKDAAVGRMRQSFVPVNGVEIGLRIPASKAARGVRLVRAGVDLAYTRTADGIRAKLPAITIGDVVHVALA